ncbi:MAG: fasciclin domain-containing protein [Candidatus Marinimicrobia bacterium]|nr:fasciclin domain-containing protein [Candidatus Neomarinimicrobiota bacterium]
MIFFKTFGILLCLSVFFACSPESNSAGETSSQVFRNDHGQAAVQDDVSDPNILQIALGSPDHTTLVAGVQAAQLENVLVGAGPLTVFAPSNTAFDKLPEGTLESLLEPENKSKLATIITSHASPGTFMGEGLKDGMKLYMATGHYVDVKVTDEGTFVNGSKILGTIDAVNGVVHVIDDVWLIAAG